MTTIQISQDKVRFVNDDETKKLTVTAVNRALSGFQQIYCDHFTRDPDDRIWTSMASQASDVFKLNAVYAKAVEYGGINPKQVPYVAFEALVRSL
jgi:hypothetical protein